LPVLDLFHTLFHELEPIVENLEYIPGVTHYMVDAVHIIHDETALIVIEYQPMFFQAREHDKPLTGKCYSAFPGYSVIQFLGESQNLHSGFRTYALMSI